MRIDLVLAGVTALLWCGPAITQTAASGQLQGTVVDETGMPITGARVTLIRKAQLALGTDGKWRTVNPSAATQILTNATGSYSAAALAAGAYDICAQAAGYLTNCEWTQWARSTLAVGATVNRGKLILTKAAIVTIRLNDPQGLLGSNDSFSMPLVAVRDQFGRVHRARETASQGTAHILAVEVPYATPVSLWTHSARFLLTDAIGGPVSPHGSALPLQVPVGGTAPAFVFNIAGEVKQ